VQQRQIGTGQTEVRDGGAQGQVAESSSRAQQQTGVSCSRRRRRTIARDVEKEHRGRRSVAVVGRRCRR